MKSTIPPFLEADLQAISRIIADTNDGLTGSEIAYMLRSCKIPDPDPGMTKWKRLYNAFCTVQNKYKVGNHVIQLINKVMAPANYLRNPDLFTLRRDQLNQALSLCGYGINEKGQVIRIANRTETLDAALAVSKRMRAELERRNAHSEIFRFCEAEVLAENYFHSVVEAIKSLSARIRKLAKVDGDGSELIDKAFSFKFPRMPRIAVNTLDSETKQGEQRGFSNLLKGLYGAVRNPLNHEAKIEWTVNEQDALDLLTMISMIHRRLDASHIIPRNEDS